MLINWDAPLEAQLKYTKEIRPARMSGCGERIWAGWRETVRIIAVDWDDNGRESVYLLNSAGIVVSVQTGDAPRKFTLRNAPPKPGIIDWDQPIESYFEGDSTPLGDCYVSHRIAYADFQLYVVRLHCKDPIFTEKLFVRLFHKHGLEYVPGRSEGPKLRIRNKEPRS